MPTFEFRCISDINRLFSLLLTKVPYVSISDEAKLSALNVEKRMERIVGYIEEHYTEKITLSEIAEMEGLTTYYLSHLFKNNLKQSFQDFVNTLRFEHALYLLQKTDMRIIDISLQSGFSDSKYLNKMFSQVYGMTPKEYRKQKAEQSETPKDRLETRREVNEYIYTTKESLEILRSNFIYPCDRGENEANPGK